MPTRASQIGVALAVVALVASLAAVLLRSEPRSAGSNSVRAEVVVHTFAPGGTVCQRGELVPGRASTVEIAVGTGGQPGPPLAAELRAPDGRVLARGRRAGGYGDGVVGVPIPVQPRTLSGAEVCLRATGPGTAQVYGQTKLTGRLAVDGRAAPGAMRLAYQRPGSESWLELAPTIAHRFSQAKTQVATPFTFWLLLALVAGTAGLAIAAVLRRSTARAARLCALVAVLNGIAWSLLVPPLQAYDEPVHVYYGQFFAETYNVPRPVPGSVLSGEELAIVNGVRLFDVVGNTDGHPPWTQAEDEALERALDSGLPRKSQGADGGVGAYPPLYYGLGAIAYMVSPSTSLLDRLEMMRLVSAALAGLTALFVCLFVRELVPRPEWAWKAAGLIAALQPTFGFLSGVFNPDMGIAAGSAALLYGIARAWRRGLTPWGGALIGGGLAAAFLSKLAAVGLVPGAALAVGALAWRQRRPRGLLTFAAAAGGPVLVYMALNRFLWDRPALLGGSETTSGGTPAPAQNLGEMLSFAWQSYLPRLPFMKDRFELDFPLWDRYFVGWVGRFGWGDYEFPEWVSVVTLVALCGLLIAAVALVARHWGAAWRRWPEWVSYAALAGGLLFLLGYTGYIWKRDTGTDFEQGRYLLPLLGFYAAIVAAGLRGLGRHAGPVVAGVLVVAAAAHSIWALLLTIARFYA